MKARWMIALLAGMAPALHAQPVATGPAAQIEQARAPLGTEDEAKALLHQDFLTGDWGGARTVLSERYGITPYLTYTGEVMGNPTGGIQQGVVYNGLVDMGVEINLETMTGGAWKGATLFANAYQIHGRSLTENYVGDLYAVSNIDAPDTIRLGELWFEQNFLEDAVSLRLGQLLADSEFATSYLSGMFLNGTFGWPGGISANAPTPAYPVGALGVRLRVEPTEDTYVMGGIFQGDSYPFNDQLKPVNNHGTYWNLNPQQGVFGIFEAAYKLNQNGEVHPSGSSDPKAMDAKGMAGSVHGFDHSHRLPGEYKIGGWFHTGEFVSNEIDVNGFPLESPLSSGDPAGVGNNWGLYLIADQMLWLECPCDYDNTMETYQGLGAFFRFFYADPDASFFNVSSEFGLTYTGLIPGRDEDTLGVGVNYSGITDSIGRVSAATGGPGFDYTMAVEVSYQVIVCPWCIVQPDLQVIIQPDGAPTSAGGLETALVLGMRTEIAF